MLHLKHFSAFIVLLINCKTSAQSRTINIDKNEHVYLYDVNRQKPIETPISKDSFYSLYLKTLPTKNPFMLLEDSGAIKIYHAFNFTIRCDNNRGEFRMYKDLHFLKSYYRTVWNGPRAFVSILPIGLDTVGHHLLFVETISPDNFWSQLKSNLKEIDYKVDTPWKISFEINNVDSAEYSGDGNFILVHGKQKRGRKGVIYFDRQKQSLMYDRHACRSYWVN